MIISIRPVTGLHIVDKPSRILIITSLTWTLAMSLDSIYRSTNVTNLLDAGHGKGGVRDDGKTHIHHNSEFYY